jgi:hypothetical protein
VYRRSVSPGTAVQRLGAPIAYLATTIALFHEAWASPTTRFIGLRGDPDQTLWFLAWGAHAVTNGMNPFFSDFMYHPDGVNLMWNAAIPLPAWLTAPITVLGGPTLTYNVLMTFAVAASAWCAYRACVHFGSGPVAAWAGGLVYGFSPFMMARALGHLNIALAFLPPLALIVLDRAIRLGERPRAHGAVFGGLLGLQVLIWSETAVIMAISFAAIVLAVLWIERDRAIDIWRSFRSAMPAMAAGFLVVGIVPILFFLLGPERPVGPLHEPGAYSTHPLNLITPSAAHHFAPAAAREITERISTGLGGRSAYLGLPLIALVGWALHRLRADPVVRIMSVSAVLVLLLSIDPAIHLGGESRTLVTSLPIVNHLLPQRLMMLVYLFIAVIVARFLSDIDRPGRRFERLLGVGLFVLVAMSFLPRLPFPATNEGVPASFRAAAVRSIPEGSVAIVLPSARALAWQATSGMHFKMPTGRAFVRTTGSVPRFVHTFALLEKDPALAISAERAEQIRDELRTAEVVRVVLVPVPRDTRAEADRAVYGHGPTTMTQPAGLEDMPARLSEILGGPPTTVAGAYVWSL